MLVLALLSILIILNGVILGKIFFIRETADDLLKKQNTLLAQILEAQKKQPAPITTAPSSTTTIPVPAVTELNPDPEFYVEEAVTTFIPKVALAKSDVSKVDTSASKWDSEGVDKLRKAKEAAKKG